MARHQSTGATGILTGEHAGDRRSRIEQHDQQVGAALVADAGGGGGQANAVDDRKVRRMLRRKRRDLAQFGLKLAGLSLLLAVGVPWLLVSTGVRGRSALNRGVVHRLFDLGVDHLDLGGVAEARDHFLCLRLH